jgi:type II secretory pathway pseudopilin PulG
MTAPRVNWRTTERRRGVRGLVLVEVLLILLVLALAAALLFTALGRIRHGVRLEKFGAELQTHAAAIEQARAERGRWPATAEEAGPRLMEGGWMAGSGFGGEYGWVPPAGGRPGMITLTAFAPGFPLELTRADLLALDRKIDDGDLATGRFRTGFNGWPVWLVADQP